MKRISPGTVTIGVFAIVFGLVAAFVVKQSFHQEPVVQRKQAKTVPIIVARVNLEKHDRIRLSDLQVVQVPATREIPGEIVRRAQVAAGRVTKQTIQAGQAINEENLYGIGESFPGIADRLPEGHRAFTIKLDQDSLRGIEDDSKIDIAMSVKGDHPDLGELATRTLLRNVQVIGVRSKQGSAGASLTLAVTSKDANKLITAQQTGTLSVTLCGAGEGEFVNDDDSITRRELLGLAEIPQPSPDPRPYTVEKWEGGSLKMIELSATHVEESRHATDAARNIANGGLFQHSQQVSTPSIRPRISAPVFENK